MTSPLSRTTTTEERTLSGSSLGFTPYSTDSTSTATAAAPERTAAQLANLRYKAPRHSLSQAMEDSPVGIDRSGASSVLSSHLFLPLVIGAGGPVSSSPPISWDPSTRRYSLVPKAAKEDLTGVEVRAAARAVSAVPDRASAAAAAALFPAKAPRRLSGPILLAPLPRAANPMPMLDEIRPS